MSRIIFFLILCFALHTTLPAQQELATHFMRDIWQSSLSNPALTTGKKIEIGLPSFYFNAAATGVSFGELIRTGPDGVNRINIPEVIANLNEDNYFLTDLEIETFRLAFEVKDLQLSFHHAIHTNAYFNYPKGLAEFVFLGNGNFVGETLELGPDIQLTAYNEFALGAAKKFGKLGLGARLKFLTGIGNISTEKSNISLSTDADIYQLQLTSDVLLNSSSFLRIEDLANFDFALNIDGYSGSDIFTKNAGFAFDLGLTFDLTDKLQLAASVRDIGGINWKENVINYKSNLNVDYDGVIIDSLFNENVSIPLSETLDSLEGVLAFTETSTAYRTSLPTKAYLSASFKMNDTWTFGGLFHTTSFRGNTDLAIALSARAKLNKRLSLGASYALRNQRYDNLGLNLSLHLGPVSVYAMTDNVLTVVQPGNSQNVNLRTGLNLSF